MNVDLMQLGFYAGFAVLGWWLKTRGGVPQAPVPQVTPPVNPGVPVVIPQTGTFLQTHQGLQMALQGIMQLAQAMSTQPNGLVLPMQPTNQNILPPADMASLLHKLVDKLAASQPVPEVVQPSLKVS
jgi:hypothetical protein